MDSWDDMVEEECVDISNEADDPVEDLVMYVESGSTVTVKDCERDWVLIWLGLYGDVPILDNKLEECVNKVVGLAEALNNELDSNELADISLAKEDALMKELADAS